MKMDENGVFLLNHGDSTPPDSAAPRGSGLEITIGEARTFKWLCSIANCWFTREYMFICLASFGFLWLLQCFV